MLERNQMRRIVGETKINKIRRQQIREFCGIQPIHEQVKRREEWDEHVKIMDAKRSVKISRDYIPAGRSPGRLKRWSDIILG